MLARGPAFAAHCSLSHDTKPLIGNNFAEFTGRADSFRHLELSWGGVRLGKVWGGRAQSPVPAAHGPAHPTYRPLCSGKVPRALGAATATDPRTRARSGPRRGLLHSENRDLNKRSSESEASPPSACPAAAPCRPHHGLCWPHVKTAQSRRDHRPPAARRSPALDDLHGLVWKAWRRCRGVGAPPLRAPVRHARSRCGEGTIDLLSTDSRAEAHLHHPSVPAGALAAPCTICPRPKSSENRPTVNTSVA